MMGCTLSSSIRLIGGFGRMIGEESGEGKSKTKVGSWLGQFGDGCTTNRPKDNSLSSKLTVVPASIQ